MTPREALRAAWPLDDAAFGRECRLLVPALFRDLDALAKWKADALRVLEPGDVEMRKDQR